MMDNISETYCHPDSANSGVRILIDTLTACGLYGVVLSPGSRNAPLLMAVAARKNLRRWVEADERNAGFIALGLAMVRQTPVALMCTSGTALYNYAPAVAEAFYQGVPLIVISADRPAEWIDQDDSQTLHQPEALSRIVKKSFDIDATVRTEADIDFRWMVNRIANEAYLLANSGKPGPVHINIRLAPPLGASVPSEVTSRRIVSMIEEGGTPAPRIMNLLSEKLAARKVMLVCGFMPPDTKLNRAVAEFAALPNSIVVAEALSNLHLSPEAYVIDTLLCRRKTFSLPDPDIVITIGGALVSRMLKEYLRGLPLLEHWTLGDTDAGIDTFRRLTTHIESRPTNFLRGITSACRRLCRQEALPEGREFKSVWNNAREVCHTRIHTGFIKDTEWSELKALDYVFRNLPRETNLFLGNGTPVRYAQLSMTKIPHACFGCRGVSGIDGTTATALGSALGYSGPTLLISGDLAFSYSPAILGSKHFPGRFKIIVINNSGGGIFRFIDATRDIPCREEYLCAPPSLPLRGLCDAYKVNYMCAGNLRELQKEFPRLMASETPSLLEIMVPAEESASILRRYLCK